MRMYEFASENRDEIFSRSEELLRRQTPGRSPGALVAHVPPFLDEIIEALRRGAGLPASALTPKESGTGARQGERLQSVGLDVRALAQSFGAVCDAITGLASARGLIFETREFQILNQCIDEGIAAALTEFWNQNQAQTERDAAQRIGFLAHELRNALASGTLSFELLRSGRVGLDSKTSDVLKSSLRRMSELVNTTLAEVQLRSGARLNPQPLRILDLLMDIEAGTVTERDVTLKLEATPELEVQGDPRLLTSAVTNLVQNALKFTRPGGVVTVRASQTDAQVLLEVEDGCGGLPQGKAEELFSPFVQKGEDRSGLGLGLAITREAVEAHGGKLAVRDLPGQGCIFEVRLPRTATVEGQASMKALAASGSSPMARE